MGTYFRKGFDVLRKYVASLCIKEGKTEINNGARSTVHVDGTDSTTLYLLTAATIEYLPSLEDLLSFFNFVRTGVMNLRDAFTYLFNAIIDLLCECERPTGRR